MPEVSRPAILAVDDDPDVLSSVERDLRSRYAADYRVVPAASGAEGIELISRLVTRGEEVALVVADQRMPHMSGTEMLTALDDLVPAARRVLLTAYADTDAAISAINDARVDYYIVKPWDPPEEKLFPVLDDLLEQWQAVGRRPPEVALRVVGHRWSAEAHRLREFLARNQVPFRWLELVTNPEGDRLLVSNPTAVPPLVVLEDGSVMSDPALPEIADRIGLVATPGTDYYDLVVVGAGPAGLAAAVYGASEGLSTAVIEEEAPGGQAGASARIENYLGFPNGVSGADLARRALTQANRFGAVLVNPRRVTGLAREDPYRVVHFDDGRNVRCSAVIIATGVQYRELEAEGADDLVGRGVYYGAVQTEASSLVGQDVVVVGGANSAGQAAVYLSNIAHRVTLAVRAEAMEARMSSYLAARIRATDNVEVVEACRVDRIGGSDHVDSVTLETGEGERTVPAAAVFAFIGARPRTEWLEGAVARDEDGFVPTGAAVVAAGRWGLDRDPLLLETSVPGVFAVGDVRAQSVKRVASAVGEGSVAVHLVHAYLAG